MLETMLGILMTLALVALAILIGKAWPTLRAMLPGWAANILVVLADMFVRWAESTYGDAPGPRKFEIVLEKLDGYLRSIGIRIETDIVRAAVEAAWEKMNTEQVAAGIKEVVGGGQ